DALGGATDKGNLAGGDSDGDAVVVHEHDGIVGMDHSRADDLPGAVRHTHGLDALATASLHAILIDLRAFAEPELGDDEKVVIGLDDIEADDLVIIVDANTDHAGGGATHGADIGFVEPDRLTSGGDEHDVAVTVGFPDPRELVLFVEPDGDQAVRAHGFELVEADPLHASVAGREEEIMVRAEVANGHQRGDRLIRLHAEDVDDRQPLGGAAGVRKLVDLELVDAAAVREDEQGIHCVGAEDVLDSVLIAHGDAGFAATAT